MEEKFGWTEIELDQICSKIVDGTHHTPEYTETGVPFISVKDIYDEKVNFDNCKYVSYETHCELIKRCNPEPNDLLITKSGTIGRMAIVPNKPEFSLFVSVALLKNYKSIINTKFLLYSLENYLNSINISQDIKGGLLKNYHLEDIRATKINLLPFPEQRAIVSKIEQLFSELDNSIANLKLAQEQLKVYRQAVLKKAFEGELTKKWREQQTNLPDAKDLLEKIRKEREEAAKVSGKRLKKVNPLTEVEFAELPRLPTGWGWVRLGEITYKVGDVDHKMPKDFPNGIPYVATNDITDELKIDFSTSKTISKEDYLILSEKIKPETGDIIFPRYGTIGKNVLVDFNKDFRLFAISCG